MPEILNGGKGARNDFNYQKVVFCMSFAEFQLCNIFFPGLS